MDYSPPIALTPAINRLCVEIGTLVGSLENRVPPRNLLMVRQIHQGQLQSLLMAQMDVEPSLRGESGESGETAGSLRRALTDAFQRLDTYDPASLSDIMRLNALLSDALGVWDIWRTEDGLATELGAMPCAPASHAPQLLEQLLDWYDRTELHPLVASCVFRYEYPVIRPFACASDLTRRLWHYRMLTRWSPVFHWIDIEAAFRDRHALMVTAVAESRRRINDAPYVAVVLETIQTALQRLDDRLEATPDRSANVEQVLLYFADRPTSTISDASASLGIAPRTCARYIAELQRDGRLVRVGSRKKGTWKVLG